MALSPHLSCLLKHIITLVPSLIGSATAPQGRERPMSLVLVAQLWLTQEEDCNLLGLTQYPKCQLIQLE